MSLQKKRPRPLYTTYLPHIFQKGEDLKILGFEILCSWDKKQCSGIDHARKLYSSSRLMKVLV